MACVGTYSVWFKPARKGMFFSRRSRAGPWLGCRARRVCRRAQCYSEKVRRDQVSANNSLAVESRFDLAYNAAQALCPAVLR